MEQKFILTKFHMEKKIRFEEAQKDYKNYSKHNNLIAQK